MDAMPKIQVAEWLAISDLQIALFKGPKVLWKDGVQNKFFDAISSGKPIACNFYGWQTKIATENKIGFYINNENHLEAAQTITSYLRNEKWLKNVPNNARKLSENDFNRDKLAKKLINILEDVRRS